MISDFGSNPSIWFSDTIWLHDFEIISYLFIIILLNNMNIIQIKRIVASVSIRIWIDRKFVLSTSRYTYYNQYGLPLPYNKDTYMFIYYGTSDIIRRYLIIIYLSKQFKLNNQLLNVKLMVLEYIS